MQYGVDVTARRADDLDKRLLAWVAARVARGHVPTVLDLGCGSGGLAARLAAAGAIVTAIDVGDYGSAIAAHNQTLPAAAAPILFTQADIAAQDFATVLQEKQYNTVVLQRVLHYLPYDRAQQLLRVLCVRTDTIYISVTGSESDIGSAHPALTWPLAQRLAQLSRAAQTTFAITAPICPYTNEEFATILQSTGWTIDDIWTSAFGNHKAVATANK